MEEEGVSGREVVRKWRVTVGGASFEKEGRGHGPEWDVRPKFSRLEPSQ
jgi:hypothetical protein